MYTCRHMALRRTTRTTLVALFSACFFIAAFFLTITMLGLVIDTKHGRLTKAGSIYIQFTPREATLAINGKPYPQSASLLNRDIYISELPPDTYELSLSLNAHAPWRKQLAVLPGKISFASRLILWPEHLPVLGSSTNILAFAPTKEGILTKGATSMLSMNGKSLPGEGVLLARADSASVVTYRGKTFYYSALDESSTTTTDIARLFSTLQRTQLHASSTQPLRTVSAHPFSKTKLIIAGNTSLFALDMKKRELEPVLTTANGILAYAANNSELLAIDTRGTLIAVNLVLHSTTHYPAHLGFATRIVSDAKGNRLLAEDEEHNLFLFDRGAQTLKKLASDIAYYSFSPDGRRAVFITKANVLSTLYLVAYEDNVPHNAGDIETVPLTTNENAATFAWIPFAPNYFLIQAGDRLLVEEFDARSPRNIAVLDRNVTRFVLDEKLYILHKDKTLTWSMLEE